MNSKESTESVEITFAKKGVFESPTSCVMNQHPKTAPGRHR